MMEDIIKQAELLITSIRRESESIDNPVLTSSVVIELKELIDFLQAEAY